MNLVERISKIGFYVLQILLAIVILMVPTIGYRVIFLFLIIICFTRGIRSLIFYLQLARLMVGGKSILYQGILFLDIGILLMNSAVLPHFILAIAIAVMLLYSGITWFLRALNKKKTHVHTWYLSLIHSIIIVLGAVLCAVFFNNQAVVASIFAVDTIYEACIKIYDTTRKTSVVFIQ